MFYIRKSAYEPAIKSPLIANRKKWKLFANYSLTNDYEVVQINTTGQLIRIKEDPDIDEMMGYVRKNHPGATVEEVISFALESTVEQTGSLKTMTNSVLIPLHYILC
ncbi:hypothetical protein [Saccharolobus caldissimus]|uniref:Uncharacterized protein n=1 Tax=Saccharolobus caldissimus TaxID=1702097 RepID=A0AAQ4CW04_9CREN|nr:hypothetical protein [Saccharolobus caldissimus]BDB99985.1 hypothetical protein SACC_30020 [Saccharolobus caldissimus]